MLLPGVHNMTIVFHPLPAAVGAVTEFPAKSQWRRDATQILVALEALAPEAREVLWYESRQVAPIDREYEEPVRLGRDEVVVVGDDEDVTAVPEVRTESQALDLLGERRPGQAEGGIQQVEQERLRDRHDAVRCSRRRKRRDPADVGRPGDVDVEHLL